MENEVICEICGEIFTPPKPRLPRYSSGKVCRYCIKHYAAY